MANLFTRDDTMLGICQGFGEDTGVPPNLLRVGFALLLFYTPAGAAAAYFGLGVLVLASRLIVREPRAAERPAGFAAQPSAQPSAQAPAPAPEPVEPARAEAAERLPEAA